jgi:hypothetical protein
MCSELVLTRVGTHVPARCDGPQIDCRNGFAPVSGGGGGGGTVIATNSHHHDPNHHDHAQQRQLEQRRCGILSDSQS